MSENRIESAAGSDANSGSCFVDPLVREYFVERYFRGEWLRNNVGTKTLEQAQEWAADPTLPVMQEWPVRIVRVDMQITKTIIPFPNVRGEESPPGGGASLRQGASEGGHPALPSAGCMPERKEDK